MRGEMVSNVAGEFDGIGHATCAKAWIGIRWPGDSLLLVGIPPDVKVRCARKDGGDAAIGLDIASGLGDRISLVGLSGGAVAAAWMAQKREGIESVVLLSPFFSVHGQPVALR